LTEFELGKIESDRILEGQGYPTLGKIRAIASSK